MSQSNTLAQLQRRRLLDKQAREAYERGFTSGLDRATHWRLDPSYGDAEAGGSLQHFVLDLAELLAKAPDEVGRSYWRGVVEGFCWSLEFPGRAELEACAAIRRARGGSR
jgi:hypothetical protein